MKKSCQPINMVFTFKMNTSLTGTGSTVMKEFTSNIFAFSVEKRRNFLGHILGHWTIGGLVLAYHD